MIKDHSFSSEMSEIGELNCIYRKIKLEIPRKCKDSVQDDSALRNYNLNISSIPYNTSVVLFLEPDAHQIPEEICLSDKSIKSYNVSISIEVNPVFNTNTEVTASPKSFKENVSECENKSSQGFILFNEDKKSGSCQSNATTSHSSPVTNINMQSSERCFSDHEEDNVQRKEETCDSSIIEKSQQVNISKRLSSIKSSIKRQLTSNRYVDICRNPEWPFIKQTSRVLSKNEQVGSMYQRIKKDVQKGTEVAISEEIGESNSVSKRSSRGRSRQWLETISTLFDGVYTQRSTLGRSAGLGLFSDRHFERNDIITEFVGWVIDRKEALRLRSEGKATHICDLVKPSLYLDGEKDPKPYIGGGSFANDGSTFLGGPGNNSKFWKWYDEREGRSRVFLKATQEIHPGEEIFVGYCKDYWVDFAEKDTNNIGSKACSVVSDSKRPVSNAQGGQSKSRKRSIKSLESDVDIETDPKSAGCEELFLRRTKENCQNTQKKSQVEMKSKKRNSL
ncbi:putative SET domain-containing protein [Cryptosporidium canis]|uniref:SET domain-containing protein n=1 Tax=Cryptosporidium canis TaxID=195482 RepID=A0ABQ8PBQ9_9CRYT|nr:putative SET domain-containing protein [Cryptosporidium canis]